MYLNVFIIYIEVLDSMLESGKPVFTLYGHDNQSQWSEVLACESSNGGVNSLDEMKSLKDFFDKHPKIEGVILTNLQYDVRIYLFLTVKLLKAKISM